MSTSYMLKWSEKMGRFEKYDVRPYIPDPGAEKGDYQVLKPGDRIEDGKHQPDPGHWFREAESKFAVDESKIGTLPQPWILVQGYWMLDDHELSLRLIPARKMAFVRLKSLDYGARDKMSFRIPYEMGRHMIFYADGCAFKYRFIVRDHTDRAWLIDYFPELDWWQAETEFPSFTIETIPAKNMPKWALNDLTYEPWGYTRERARSRSFKEYTEIMKHAVEFGSNEEYEPGDDDFNWIGNTKEKKPE